MACRTAQASALTYRLISLVGVKWSCLRINKQAFPPLPGGGEKRGKLVLEQDAVVPTRPRQKDFSHASENASTCP